MVLALNKYRQDKAGDISCRNIALLHGGLEKGRSRAGYKAASKAMKKYLMPRCTTIKMPIYYSK